MMSDAFRKAQEKPSRRERRPSKATKSSKIGSAPRFPDETPLPSSLQKSHCKDPSISTCTTSPLLEKKRTFRPIDDEVGKCRVPASSPRLEKKKNLLPINDKALPLARTSPKVSKPKIRVNEPMTPATAATTATKCTTSGKSSNKKDKKDKDPGPRRIGMKIYAENNSSDSLSCITMLTADFPAAKEPPAKSAPIVEELEISNSSSNRGWATFDNSPFDELNASKTLASSHGSDKSAPRRRADSFLQDSIHTCFFTFRRGDKKTTIKGKVNAVDPVEVGSLGSSSGQRPEDESMADVVKRLQQSSSSGVLRFDKRDVRDLKNGQKHLIFTLPTCGGNPRFTKEEFGNLRASDLMSLSTEHPVLVEICMEDVGDGEVYDIF